MISLPYQAVIVDLDQTLLRTDKTVSAYTREVLAEWQSEGAFLYAATARPERAVTEYMELLRFRSVTTLNGARTITPAGASECPLDPAGAASLLEQLCRVEGAVVSAETEKGIFANRPIPLWNPEVLPDLRQLAGSVKIYKILVSHPDMEPDRIPVVPPEDVYSTVADRSLVQFMNRGATKWNGIRRMLDRDGIPASRAIYFGDDNDDLEPIRKCGCGVAVRNALPSVIRAADAVAPGNDEDGVARFLAGLVSGRSAPL